MAFFDLVDRWKRQGFPRSTGIASGDARFGKLNGQRGEPLK
jgi:hypothetical protein